MTKTRSPGREVAALPRRDRIAVLAGLAGATAVAWAYLALLAARMDGTEGMDGMAAMGGAAAVAIHPWSAADFLLTFLMWAVMMVGMMVPTAAPTTLVYAAVARKAARQGTPVAPTAAFVAGYVAVWTVYSVAATAAQGGLDRAALLSPMMVTTSPAVGALLLVAAGIYQLTPAKEACLRRCREPARFIAQHWRTGTAGAFRMGAIHGGYCLGSCWALMGLLFVGGVMNLLWVAAIALFVLAEKILPGRGGAARLTGFAMIAGGCAAGIYWLSATSGG